MVRLVPDPQTTIDEKVVENDKLEQALEEREKLKAKAGKARKDYAEADEWAKGLIGELRLDDGAAVRVGRFRVSRTAVAGRSVAFETQPSSRLTISLLDDEDGF
jgi:hypothetical protein